MKRVVWSDEALADLLAIIQYIRQDNPAAALRIAQRIQEAGNALETFATGRRGRVEGTFEKVLPPLPYILAYEILPQPDAADDIVIPHVIHGARDWPEGTWPGEE